MARGINEKNMQDYKFFIPKNPKSNRGLREKLGFPLSTSGLTPSSAAIAALRIDGARFDVQPNSTEAQ